MLAFIKKKRTDEENLLEMTAATNSNVESSMVSAASNIQSRTNVESLVDRNVDVHMDREHEENVIEEDINAVLEGVV